MGWAQTNANEISRNAAELLEQRRAEAEFARSLAGGRPGRPLAQRRGRTLESGRPADSERRRMVGGGSP